MTNLEVLHWLRQHRLTRSSAAGEIYAPMDWVLDERRLAQIGRVLEEIGATKPKLRLLVDRSTG